MKLPEHTCGGMYDLSCEACYELQLQRDSRREDLPGESRNTAADDYEPCEWDVVGGL